MYAFTNQFTGPSLRQRVGMMNRQRSKTGPWWRYGAWSILMGLMAMACRHDRNDLSIIDQPFGAETQPASSLTQAIVADLENRGTWYRHLALSQSEFDSEIIQSKPVIVQLKDNRFTLPDDYKYESTVYMNGKEVPVEALGKLSPEFVRELFVMHQWENMANADPQMKPYQLIIQTSPQAVPLTEKRKKFFMLLQAAAISQHPLGESFSFSMNQLLEATFFHNKNALVERTKNEHLSVYDEYAKTVEVFINQVPATTADVKAIHVREVARLYTKERPYTAWFQTTNALPRFELHIQTEPKRAKRDSSYYVFSPFYSGDF